MALLDLRSRVVVVSLFFTAFATGLPPASAAILYESGTLGPTGVAYGTTEGTNINSFVYAGVRFEVTQPSVTTQVGGHFVAFTGGTFFGALVKLSGPTDFPDSGNLSTPDVPGATTLTFPALSAETFGELAVPLNPGWYALVFGSGLFGTNGRGGAVRNGINEGEPGFISFQPLSGAPWLNSPVTTANARFIATGTLIPEPSAWTIFMIACLLLGTMRIIRWPSR